MRKYKLQVEKKHRIYLDGGLMAKRFDHLGRMALLNFLTGKANKPDRILSALQKLRFIWFTEGYGDRTKQQGKNEDKISYGFRGVSKLI